MMEVLNTQFSELEDTEAVLNNKAKNSMLVTEAER